ncbi:MAG: penicillin-binding protein activator LpoB [Bdellovibrionales bacterium]|nr:penicillin-binding protein activator LpoB [Bdellovibrionales bacterium]NQZ19167.1 penicillin-binding protein activator LpoB [Bdellovibrionales bacterium]
MAKMTMMLLAALMLLAACGPKGYTRGEYDEDVTADNMLDDRWSESDMQKVVENLVGKMMKHRVVKNSKVPPIVMVTRLQNKTSEHIDTQSIMDMVRVELSNGGLVRFVDKAAREDVAEEYKYQDSGMVSNESKKTKGGQIGADFIINGRLDSIVKEIDRKKTVYYKVTLNLTNLKTNIIEWTGYKQLRKRYKKRRIGL